MEKYIGHRLQLLHDRNRTIPFGLIVLYHRLGTGLPFSDTFMNFICFPNRASVGEVNDTDAHLFLRDLPNLIRPGRLRLSREKMESIQVAMEDEGFNTEDLMAYVSRLTRVTFPQESKSTLKLNNSSLTLLHTPVLKAGFSATVLHPGSSCHYITRMNNTRAQPYSLG